MATWLAVATLGTPWLAASPAAGATRNTIGAGGNDSGFDMAAETKLSVVEAAVAAIPTPLPAGPVQPTWDSLKANYKAPNWFAEAKDLPKNNLYNWI